MGAALEVPLGWGGGYGVAVVTSRLLLMASDTVNLGRMDLKGWFLLSIPTFRGSF